MRATVTVVSADLPCGEDVVIDAPGTTPAGDIAAEIAAAIGVQPTGPTLAARTLAAPTLAADGEAIDPSAPFATTRLRDGAVVVLANEAGPAGARPRDDPAPSLGSAPKRSLVDDVDGHRRVSRPPRLSVIDPATNPREVAFPARPQLREPARLPLIATVAPLVAGVALAALMRRPEYLLFTVLSPLMMAGQWLADRVGQRRANRAATATYETELSAAHRRLVEALASEVADRETWTPDPAAVSEIATAATPQLWERRRRDSDFTAVRVGLGPVPATTIPRNADIEPPVLANAPVALKLRDVGVLGLAGRPDRVRALARSLVAQLATLHSPRDLAIVVLAQPAAADEWAWTRWLPHLRTAEGTRSQALVGVDATTTAARVAELTALVATREHTAADTAPRSIVVILDGARALRATSGLADVLRAGRSASVFAICIESDSARLPEECGAVMHLSDDGSGRAELSVANAPAVTDISPDDVSWEAAERVARALAPLRDDTPPEGVAALPDSVRWLEVANLADSTDGLAAELAARWRAGTANTAALLGSGNDGVFEVDIARDGPHALIAGTTGSGKSELLQTLVASLAVANRPDALTFVLVDYKGGAAFGACGALPHTVGLVTDLDGSLAERALVSLTAELKRRESLFASVRATDIDGYRATGKTLARLVIVVDEFASLAEELPDFVGGLVGIAQRGRSLGVHLVLATQRPEGVVSADIRANTNLRICLAVTRESESRDVIDASDAARISRLTPGRAYARTGHRELRAFQCGRVGGFQSSGVDASRARIAPFRSLGYPEPAVERSAEHSETDLDVVVAACANAAKYLDIEVPASPWLPPLPDLVTSSEHNDAPLTATLGWRDLPALQQRAPYLVDLARHGHLLVAGSARSGRTSALRTLAGLLARGTPTADLHLYAFDCAGGALAALANLPQCGAVVAAHETDRARRLTSMLVGELATRRAELAAQGFGSIDEQRERSCAPLPHVAVFIDGWESFVSSFEDVDGGRVVDGVFELLRDGASAGLHVVATADRAGLIGRLASLVDERLVLRLADRSDFTLIGLPTRAVPENLPAGRAFSARDLSQLQVCLLSRDPSGAGQLAAFNAIAATAASRDAGVAASSRPRRVDELPTHVVLAELEQSLGRRERAGSARVLLGVGGDQLEPVLVDLADIGPGFVIAGPPRSGKSTALGCVAASLAAAGWSTALISARPSSAATCVDVELSASDPRVAEVLSTSDRPLAVLVDDAERILDTHAAGPLERFARECRDAGHLLVVAGATEELAIGFRGFVVEARRSRCGVLLAPRSPLDGEVFGVRLPRDTGGRVPPGRGLLIEHGAVTSLQVATPGAVPVTSKR